MEDQVALPLYLQINKTINNILNMGYFGYIIGSKKIIII